MNTFTPEELRQRELERVVREMTKHIDTFLEGIKQKDWKVEHTQLLPKILDQRIKEMVGGAVDAKKIEELRVAYLQKTLFQAFGVEEVKQ